MTGGAAAGAPSAAAAPAPGTVLTPVTVDPPDTERSLRTRICALKPLPHSLHLELWAALWARARGGAPGPARLMGYSRAVRRAAAARGSRRQPKWCSAEKWCRPSAWRHNGDVQAWEQRGLHASGDSERRHGRAQQQLGARRPRGGRPGFSRRSRSGRRRVRLRGGPHRRRRWACHLHPLPRRSWPGAAPAAAAGCAAAPRRCWRRRARCVEEPCLSAAGAAILWRGRHRARQDVRQRANQARQPVLARRRAQRGATPVCVLRTRHAGRCAAAGVAAVHGNHKGYVTPSSAHRLGSHCILCSWFGLGRHG